MSSRQNRPSSSVADLPGVSGLSAEVGDADDRVGGRPARHSDGSARRRDCREPSSASLHRRGSSSLSGNARPAQRRLADLRLNVDERVAHAVDVVIHRGRFYGPAGRTAKPPTGTVLRSLPSTAEIVGWDKAGFAAAGPPLRAGRPGPRQAVGPASSQSTAHGGLVHGHVDFDFVRTVDFVVDGIGPLVFVRRARRTGESLARRRSGSRATARWP